MPEPVRITSTKNPIVQRFHAAAGGQQPDAMVADGVRLVREAVLDAGVAPDELVTSPRLVASAQGRALRRDLISAGFEMLDCSDEVLAKISHLTTHQGVAAILPRPHHQLDEVLTPDPSTLVLVAAGVRDPGNLGALVRTAEAAGATGVVALAGGADPFRDKAVRGSAGSVFRLPVVGGLTPGALLHALGEAGVRLVVADGGAEVDYLDAELRGPTALAVGGEGGGVPVDLAAAEGTAITRVRIPMCPPVDSLNVAVAAAVLLYEARRQRR